MSLSRSARWAIEWRHGWPVAFAHHPLCARHRHETWQIGRMHLCRGCAAMGAGLVSGTIAVLAMPGPWPGPLALALAVPVLLLSWPRWWPRLWRPLRDGLRLALGLLIPLATHAVATAPTTFWPVLPAAALLWWTYRQARRQVQARRCDGCPELGRGICSGYALQAQAMRAIATEIEERLLPSLEGGGSPPFGESGRARG